jgi:chromosome segregation ATPase
MCFTGINNDLKQKLRRSVERGVEIATEGMNLRNEVNSKTYQLSTLNNDLVATVSELESLRSSKDKLKSEYDTKLVELKAAHLQMNQIESELLSKCIELEENRSEIKLLQGKLQSSSDSMVDQLSKHAELQDELSAAKEKEHRLEDLVRGLEEQVENGSAELHVLRGRCESLQSENERVVQINTESQLSITSLLDELKHVYESVHTSDEKLAEAYKKHTEDEGALFLFIYGWGIRR